MNKVILVGRLAKDPELRKTNTDISVCQFTLAVNRAYVKNGEKQADFISCVAFRIQAENLAKYMRKGSQIGIDGKIQTRNYEDNTGAKKYVTEVICDTIYFLESKGTSRSGYSDVNGYDVPDAPSNKRDSNIDPFADLNGNSDDDGSQDNNEDPFGDLKTSSNVSNDDLPF